MGLMDQFCSLVERINTPFELRKLDDGTQLALVPHGSRVETVTRHPQPKPADPWIRESRAFHESDSLARYVAKYKQADSFLVANLTARRISCTIDYHGADAAMTADHTASWTVQHSDEFADWQAFEGKYHPQSDFVQFLEENATDVLHPDAASMLDLCRDFATVENVDFKSSVRLDSGDREFRFARESQVLGSVKVPQKIRLEMPIFYGEDPVQFDALFRYRTDGGGVRMGYFFHRMQPVMDAAFKLAVTSVADGCGLDPYYGDC